MNVLAIVVSYLTNYLSQVSSIDTTVLYTVQILCELGNVWKKNRGNFFLIEHDFFSWLYRLWVKPEELIKIDNLEHVK